MPKKPNIVLCTCDQLRAFEVGCYGNEVIRTPNVDRLAEEGVRFETAITNFPVCMAARSVLISGQYNRSCTGGVSNVHYPSRPGDVNMPEYPDFGRPHLKLPTLPEVLHEFGYYNAAIGKWHIHSWPDEVGFDYYLIPRVHHCHSGQSFTENGGPEFVPAGWSVDFEAEQVEQLVRERKESDQPFFLYYNISPPHCPVADAPEEYLTMYSPDEVPIRPNVDLTVPLKNQDYWFKVYRWDFRYYNLHLPYTEQLPEGYSLRHLIAEYCGVTTWMDEAVGRMLRALDRAGLSDNTIVVFTSDHGDNLGSHGLVQKGGPTEESIRVPMVLRWPQLAGAPDVVQEPVISLVDLMPTLVDLVGGEIPDHCHGHSFAPVLRGDRGTSSEDHAFVETANGVGLRTPTHLYALNWEGPARILNETPTCFYDMTHDPYQLNNMAGTGEQRGIAEVLDRRLRLWHEETPWREAS
ncbi:MAG: sulfatase-like hydrolase/transferase [Armatimonadetes bacterium]|nr:sulfatase-like hydrolase/transferase [Armatimonadota bacterium]